jgi:type I restriction-modification system DNA methylase subunit
MSAGAYYTPKRFADTWTGEPPAGTERVEFTRLLANPPYATGTEYEPASGTGAFLADAERMVEEHGQ